jgi:hypothetical protein
MREQRIVLEHGVDVAAIEIEPEVGCSKPAMRRRQVVLPEPEGPSMAKNSPGTMSRSTASTARTLPKWRETFWKETADVMGCPDLSGSSSSGAALPLIRLPAPSPRIVTGRRDLVETLATPLSPFFTGRG